MTIRKWRLIVAVVFIFSSFSFVSADSANAARAEIKTFKSPGPVYQAPRKSLYGIGTGEGTGDTIVIVNGNIHSAFAASPKKIQIDNSIKTVASSLTYVNVAVWTEIPIPSPLKKPAELDALINATLKKLGYELGGSFPFLLKGTIPAVDFHLTTQGKTFKFSDRKVQGIIVGFFTRKANADGSFESSKVMHFISDDGKRAGVVDTLTIDPADKVNLFLPR